MASKQESRGVTPSNYTLHPTSTPPLRSGVAAGERGRWAALEGSWYLRDEATAVASQRYVLTEAHHC